jgi:protein-S-isoprenylcysteine O-methyltransferase Ste14
MDDLNLSAVAAFLLYGAATVAMLGARSFHQAPATGWPRLRRLTARRLTRAEQASRACFGLAILAGLLSPLLAAAHRLPVYGHTEHAVALNAVVGELDWLGLAVAAGAIAVACLALHTMTSLGPTGVDPAKRTAEAANGIFAVIRNPIFTAMVTLQVGVTLIAPTWLAVAGVAAAVLASQIQTRLVEEPYVLATQGPAYRSYAARAGRFVPALGCLRAETAEAPLPARH